MLFVERCADLPDFLLFKQLPHQGTGTFEAYHTWMWVPVLQEDGTFGGLWNATIDTTKKVLAERRLATVREMGERTSIARTMTEFNSAVIEILTANARDAPFALLYHVETENETDKKDAKPTSTTSTAVHSDGQKRIKVTLAGQIGVPEGHTSAPSKIHLKLGTKPREGRLSTAGPFSQNIMGSPTMSFVSSISAPHSTRSDPLVIRAGTPTLDGSDESMPSISDQWPIREALQSRRLVLVEDCSSLIEGYPIRVWDELPNAAIVVPIANDSDEGVPPAVMIIGLSIRRPFDADYESFIHV